MPIIRSILRKIFTFGNKRPRRLCFAVGLYTIGYQTYDMSYASIMHNSRPNVNLQNRYGSGSWVVISGGANALAQEYAMTMASKGFNLILVDQDGEAMRKVKDATEAKYPKSKVHCVYFDHETKDEWQEYETLCQYI